jgi:hypothetical protein
MRQELAKEKIAAKDGKARGTECVSQHTQQRRFAIRSGASVRIIQFAPAFVEGCKYPRTGASLFDKSENASQVGMAISIVGSSPDRFSTIAWSGRSRSEFQLDIRLRGDWVTRSIRTI